MPTTRSALTLPFFVLALGGCGAPFEVQVGVARSPGRVGVLLAPEVDPSLPPDFELLLPEQTLRLSCGDEARCVLPVAIAPERLEGATLCRPDGRCAVLSRPNGWLEAPERISARFVDGAVEVRWAAVRGATSYRIELWDADRGIGLGEAVETSELSARLPGVSGIENLAVIAEALRRDGAIAASKALAPVTSAPGLPGRWRLYGPADFVNGTLELSAPLGPGERLGVVVLNVGGPAALPIAAGTGGSLLARLDAMDGLDTQRAALSRGPTEAEALTRLERRAIDAQTQGLRSAAPARPAKTSFCVLRELDPDRPVRREAVRVAESRTVSIYVDAAELEQYPPDAFARLADVWETQLAPRLSEALGAPSDVDGEGRVAILLTGAMGARHGGYFNPADLSSARDSSPDCGGSASNGGEVLYLNSLAHSAPSVDEMFGSYYPSTLAHELAHLTHYARRCVERTCRAPEETWISEGVAKLAEDVAGFGWHLAGWRATSAEYLAGEYARRSLTDWEGDAVGSYAQAHSFFRFFADRHGPRFLREVLSADEPGTGAVERALGWPFARALAEWTTALWASNEAWSPSPRFDFLGDAWAPLHERIGPFVPLALEGGRTLRRDGFAALLAPAGTSTLRLTTTVPDAAWVVAMPVADQ